MIATYHQVLSKPIHQLNQMELALRDRIQEIYGIDLEKFALYAKLAVELDDTGSLGAIRVKI
jgi:hypothetical protein